MCFSPLKLVQSRLAGLCPGSVENELGFVLRFGTIRVAGQFALMGKFHRVPSKSPSKGLRRLHDIAHMDPRKCLNFGLLVLGEFPSWGPLHDLSAYSIDNIGAWRGGDPPRLEALRRLDIFLSHCARKRGHLNHIVRLALLARLARLVGLN